MAEPNPTAPRLFAFVVMPFKAEHDELFQIIKDAARACDVYAERVDEQVFEAAVIEHVHNQINKADFVIAVLTGLNPNVMYEFGYAVALRRTVISIYRRGEQIPFDLNQQALVLYEQQADLGPALRTRLEGLIKLRTVSGRQRPLVQRDIYLGGTLLRTEEETSAKGHWTPDGWGSGPAGHATVTQARVGFRLAVRNPAAVLETPVVEYVGVQPAEPGASFPPMTLSGGARLSSVTMPDGEVVSLVRLDIEPVPDLWTEYLFAFGPSLAKGSTPNVEKHGVLVFVTHYTSLGPRRFTVRVRPEGFVRQDNLQFGWGA